MKSHVKDSKWPDLSQRLAPVHLYSCFYHKLNNYLLYMYISIKKPTLMYVTAVNIKNSHLFFHTDIFRNCIPSSVYVCV